MGVILLLLSGCARPGAGPTAPRRAVHKTSPSTGPAAGAVATPPPERARRPGAASPGPADAQAPKHASPAALLVTPPKSAPAPWRLPPLSHEKRNPFETLQVVATDSRLSLVRTPAGLFAADDRLGVVGPLAPPVRATWVGLGAGHTVLAALAGGSLLVAAGAPAAARGLFKPLAAVPGATRWDAAGRFVAAATAARVFLSTDGGRHFRPRSQGLPAGFRVGRVRVRDDGVVAVRGAVGRRAREVTYVARRRHRFARARFQPAGLQRRGPWIWNGYWGCPAVLARDGRHWVRVRHRMLDRAPDREGLFDTSHQLVARAEPGPRKVLLAPAARAPAELRGADKGCHRPSSADRLAVQAQANTGFLEVLGTSSAGGNYGQMVSGGLAGQLSCRDWSCVRRGNRAIDLRVPRSSYLLADGACAAADADKSGACRPGARFVRRPHIVVIDLAAMRASILALPHGCARRAATGAAAGLALLFCRAGAGATRVYALDGTRWRDEATLPVSARAIWLPELRAAPDGTIALYPRCPNRGQSCRAFVRVPVAIGAAHAWREVAPAGAVGFWVVGGGAILALRDLGEQGRAHRVTFTLSTPAGDRDLVTGVKIRADVDMLQVRHGRIEITYHKHRRGNRRRGSLNAVIANVRRGQRTGTGKTKATPGASHPRRGGRFVVTTAGTLVKPSQLAAGPAAGQRGNTGR